MLDGEATGTDIPQLSGRRLIAGSEAERGCPYYEDIGALHWLCIDADELPLTAERA